MDGLGPRLCPDPHAAAQVTIYARTYRLINADSFTNLTRSSGLELRSDFPFLHVLGCQNMRRPWVPFANLSWTARLLTSIVRII